LTCMNYGGEDKSTKRKPIVIGVFLFVLLWSFPLVFATQPLQIFRISVENTTSHVQTQSVQRFADLLSQRLAGKLDVQFYPAASLFRDTDVFRALSQGKLEMAVPGTWQFDRYVPEIGIFLLPRFFGQNADVNYAIMESPLGNSLTSKIERDLNVRVLGRWIDLGHTHLFSTRTIVRSLNDIAGLRIRVAGGVGNSLRIEALGGKPITIAWPDLPQALSRNSVDGLLTSYETMASAALWQSGIAYVYEDRQYFAQYVPIVAMEFWLRLPQEIRDTISMTWDECVVPAREQAAIAQRNAKLRLIAEGVKVTVPSKDMQDATLAKLIEHEDAIAERMGIPKELLSELIDFFTTYNAGFIGSHSSGTL
jgi:TRAP-type C4-dicarboxylate transport system substrate-binding protein